MNVNRSSVQCGSHQVDHFFQPLTVGFVKTVRFITVYVQYSFYYLIIYDWNHDFRTGFATACDMSGKKIHIGHYQRACLLPCRTADTTSFPDTVAGNASLERPECEFLFGFTR